ncbi:recombinase family protein [Mesorhizobium sophorae]|uniref:recombinase family protein n=1 Tax=Mesorhizobium sophorae TaxID=1300294 RepID=UPI000BA399C3|nr:recombinase family protein [Mesorhizobium sophorae]
MKSLANSYNENVETPPLALSYARVSQMIQAEGDGIRRQSDSFDEGEQRYAVKIASEHQMIDMGLSAYKGKHLLSGALGVLLREAEAGKFPFGTILFVESLDRISRAKPEDALRLLLAIVNTGLVVVTTIDWQEYRKGHMDMNTLFKSIMKMEVAHEESAKKEYRTKQSYAKRYAKAKENGILPRQSMFGWLTKDPETGKAVFHSEQRRALVERMCDMSMAGCGYPKIAKTLNAAGEPPFSTEKRSTKPARFWNTANVSHILKNPALYGDYHRKDKTVMEGIFPAVITKEEFYRMQAGMAARLKVGRGRKGETYSNLFGGIAKCGYCKEPMRHRPAKPGRAEQFYCFGSLNGMCHDAAPWNYDRFEASFLAFVNEIDLKTIIHGGSGSRIQEITDTIQTLEGERQSLQKGIVAIANMVRKNDSLAKTLQPGIDADQAKLDAINEQVKTLETERNTIRAGHTAAKESNLEHFPTVGTEPGQVTVEKLYELRAKAANHIRTIVESIELERKHYAKLYRRAATNAETDAEREFWTEQAEHAAHVVASRKTALDSRYTIKFKGGAMRIIYPDNRDKEGREAFEVFNVGFTGDKAKLPKATRSSKEFELARSGKV